jgi:hypothetical protein
MVGSAQQVGALCAWLLSDDDVCLAAYHWCNIIIITTEEQGKANLHFLSHLQIRFA